MGEIRITCIKREKKGGYGIYTEDGLACLLHPDAYSASGLKEGAETTPDALERLKLDSDGKAACEKALRLLSAREYASGGLRQKLACYGEEAADGAVRRMIELGLVNDEDYARRYASDCVRLKGFSPLRARRELIQRGVPPDIAWDVTSKIEEDTDGASAIEGVILKKYARYLYDEKGVRKTVNALLRLGYAYSDIYAVLRRMRRNGDIGPRADAEDS